MSNPLTILLVDDGADDLELLSLLLHHAFAEVRIEAARDAASLARAISAGRFGAVLTEHELSWIRSGDLLRLIHDLRPDCPVLVVTSRPIERVAAEIVHLAPDGVLPKSPSGLVALPRALREALLTARRRTQAQGTEPVSRRLLDALPAGVFVIGPTGTVEDANPSLARLLGHSSAADCIERPFAGWFASAAEAGALLARIGEGESSIAVDTRLKRADGSAFPVRLALWRAGESAVAIQGMATALPDEASGAAAPQAPAAVAAAGSPLAGDELAFAVSHDLQQPLTQIVRFLELLAEGAAGRAGTESARLLEQARSSAARLEERYEALHRLARLESDARAHASVELDTVADRAIARLAPDCEALGGRIDRTPLPTVDGDREQLELLFQNLLGNALKFRGPEAPRVRIQGEASGNSWHFRVEDNGIGVPPKDAERIFQLFQRLHTAAETPGTGIGLALCRRIVERHGGSIWVEPRPGGGSVFHFTLSRRTAKSLDEPRSERR